MQRAAAPLRALADTDFCLSAGGDMLCSVTALDRSAWRIGIEDPYDPGRIVAVVPVRVGGLATSARTNRGAHIVDPRTGENADR